MNESGNRAPLPDVEKDLDATDLRDALRVAVPVEKAEVVQERRARLVNAIETEIQNAPGRQRRAERKRQLATILKYGSVAALLVATLGLGMWLSSTKQTGAAGVKSTDSHTSTDNHAVELSPGSGSILAAARTAERVFELPGQTRISLHPQSQVALLDDSIRSQVMRLEQGGVQVAVPPPDGETHRSVSVLTPHAKVMVKGTKFSVELLGKGAEGRTHVVVTRGVVEVEHLDGRVTLRRGQSWVSEHGAVLSSNTDVPLSTSQERPSAVLQAEASPDAAIQEGRKPAGAGNRQEAKRTSSIQEDSPVQASTLGAQNELLEAALVAADRGDHEQALRLTARLLNQYPSSPLRASARAVRKRAKAAAETALVP